MKTLLSIGHGYSAQALARLLLPQGWAVIGTTRSPERARAFAAEGVEPLLLPGPLAPALARATHILTSVAPDATGDPILRDHAAELRAAVEADDAVTLRRLLAEARIARQNLDRSE